MAVPSEQRSMLRPTIRKRILGIAIGLIVLMAITSALSTVMTRKIAHQLDEFLVRVAAQEIVARAAVREWRQHGDDGIDENHEVGT